MGDWGAWGTCQGSAILLTDLWWASSGGDDASRDGSCQQVRGLDLAGPGFDCVYECEFRVEGFGV